MREREIITRFPGRRGINRDDYSTPGSPLVMPIHNVAMVYQSDTVWYILGLGRLIDYRTR